MAVAHPVQHHPPMVWEVALAPAWGQPARAPGQIRRAVPTGPSLRTPSDRRPRQTRGGALGPRRRQRQPLAQGPGALRQSWRGLRLCRPRAARLVAKSRCLSKLDGSNMSWARHAPMEHAARHNSHRFEDHALGICMFSFGIGVTPELEGSGGIRTNIRTYLRGWVETCDRTQGSEACAVNCSAAIALHPLKNVQLQEYFWQLCSKPPRFVPFGLTPPFWGPRKAIPSGRSVPP